MEHVNVRSLRTSMGMTIEQLARALGVSARTVSRWEAGRTVPHDVMVSRMEQMLAESAVSPDASVSHG